MRFVKSIVPIAIGLLLDHSKIYSSTLEMSRPWYEGVCWRS